MRTITRTKAIDDIRALLMTLVDDEHSICDVAASRHIFCGGFARWTFTELKQRHPQIVRSRHALTPAELRDLANRWQLARQFVTHDAIACDLQQHEASNKLCKGWDEFTDEQMASFHYEICGEKISIEPSAPSGPKP